MKSEIYVISGGPGTGKTTIIEALKNKGYDIFPEAARTIGQTDSRFKGKSILEIDKKEFQYAIFNLQKKQLEKTSNKIIFSDRGIGDTLAYYKINNIKTSQEIIEYSKKFRYSKIFILDPLNFYKKDDLRQESKEEQMKIHRTIIETYEWLGYNLVFVPCMSIKKRTNFILKNLN